MKTNRAIIALSLLACAGNLQAGSFNTCSNGNKHHVPPKLLSIFPLKFEPAVTLSASAIGFPANSTWRAALQTVASRWNGSPSFVSYVMSFDDPSIGEGNNQSEVWWSSGFGAPAVCKNWIDCSTGNIVESDVIFDNTVAYTTSTATAAVLSYAGTGRPFHTTAMHELGHAQGLAHTANTYSIMGQDWDHIHANGGVTTAHPGEDAIATSMGLYGVRANPPQDLGVVHWRWTGSSGQYSTHDRTRVFNLSGVELGKFFQGGEPVYYVSKGSSVSVEFSFENMRSSFITTAIRYVLSTNDLISTFDTSLGQQSIGISPDSVFTFRRTVTIPSNLVSGTTYWIGVIVDVDGALGEVNESNNATYVAIRVL